MVKPASLTIMAKSSDSPKECPLTLRPTNITKKITKPFANIIHNVVSGGNSVNAWKKPFLKKASLTFTLPRDGRATLIRLLV